MSILINKRDYIICEVEYDNSFQSTDNDYDHVAISKTIDSDGLRYFSKYELGWFKVCFSQYVF